jgi:hypothetical protein
MQPFTFLQPCELQKPLTVTQLSGVAFTADVLAATFMVDVLESGEAVSLTGATVTGYAIRADGATVLLTGSASGNRASITLDASCYIVQGALDIVIKVTSGGATVTVGAWRAYVQRSTTDAIVDPGHVIPSIEELLEKIDEMEAGTAAANAAAAAATTAAENADTKAGLADTAATRADAAAAALENMDASASTLTPGSPATAQITTVSGHYRALFGIPKGDTGATGPAPQIASTVTTYQESSSGSAVPSGTWQNAIPNPLTQGMFLWIRTVITYDTGDTLTQYSVSHQGLDGNGSVNSVNGVSPDANGNVTLPKDSAPTQDSTNLITSGAVYAADAAQDTQIASLENDLGIVEDGDTATHTIAQGQYVIWQGALYTADAAIASGTTLAASGGNKNLTAVENGGLNALYSKLSGLQLVKVDKTVAIPDGTQTEQTVTVDMSDVVPSGKVIHSISDARLSQYALPYISGSKFTWISTINDRSISIKSTATAWNQYLLHVTLFIA